MLVRRSRQLPGISESGTESVAYRPKISSPFQVLCWSFRTVLAVDMNRWRKRPFVRRRHNYA